MKLIDIHAHLNDAAFEADREAVIARTVAADCGVINVGTDLKSSEAVVALTTNPNFYATVGVHPDEIAGLDEAAWTALEQLASHEKVVAIGECGLDYFRLTDDVAATKERQRAAFEWQIALAIKLAKPLMLHIRDSYDDVLAILKNFPAARGNAHFFAGNTDQAKQFLDLGFTLSFTGVITFTTDYDELIKLVPLDRLMAETDSPYVSPVPFRGQRNEPLHVLATIEKMAQIKGISTESLLKATLNNAICNYLPSLLL